MATEKQVDTDKAGRSPGGSGRKRKTSSCRESDAAESDAASGNDEPQTSAYPRDDYHRVNTTAPEIGNANTATPATMPDNGFRFQPAEERGVGTDELDSLESDDRQNDKQNDK